MTDSSQKMIPAAALFISGNPRELLICTGPPYNKEDDAVLAAEVRDFKGKKIVMGATTGDIISRELGLKIEDVFKFEDPELPPIM